MHYEVWALNTGNLIRDCATEAEALGMVRELLADGWDADDIGLRREYDDGEPMSDREPGPAMFGASLVERVEAERGRASSTA